MHIENGVVRLRVVSKVHGEHVILFDESDLPLLQNYFWRVAKDHLTYYARASVKTENGQKTITMHRLLMGFPDNEVDHENRNGLDNRRSNIRHATHSQNQSNKRMMANNTSGYRGVVWHKNRKKWYAMIKVDGRKRFLGSFDTKEDAAAAYRDAFIERFGDFASLEEHAVI